MAMVVGAAALDQPYQVDDETGAGAGAAEELQTCHWEVVAAFTGVGVVVVPTQSTHWLVVVVTTLTGVVVVVVLTQSTHWLVVVVFGLTGVVVVVEVPVSKGQVMLFSHDRRHLQSAHVLVVVVFGITGVVVVVVVVPAKIRSCFSITRRVTYSPPTW